MPDIPGREPERWERQMRSPGRLRARPGEGERGSLTLMLAVLFVALLAMAGIVIDGGAKLNAAENATAIAQEAARSGAGMVNRSSALSTGTFAVDPGQAVAAARAYLARAGYHGNVTLAGNDAIRVTVTVTVPTKVLSLIGIDSMTSTGSATAVLVTGVTGPGT
jgi:Flp pilus assembly protein TadG